MALIPNEQKEQRNDGRSPMSIEKKSKGQPTLTSSKVAIKSEPKTSKNPVRTNRSSKSNASDGGQTSSYHVNPTDRKIPSDSWSKDLESYAKKTQELKQDIKDALDRQSNINSVDDNPMEISQLRSEILSMSQIGQDRSGSVSTGAEDHSNPPADETSQMSDSVQIDAKQREAIDNSVEGIALAPSDARGEPNIIDNSPNDVAISVALNENELDTSAISTTETKAANESEFELLKAKLDQDSKYAALLASLQQQFGELPKALEPICRRLVAMSEENDFLRSDLNSCNIEKNKLISVKQKLENLCRELQKSNNAIRIESFDLIRLEQAKAKEQAAKIQSTLSGVIKLFDDNQQRNMALRQENHELQNRLKALLSHCDNWEKSTETALKQRDIENRLMRTELAKANLLRSEDKEKHLSEKQELLQIMSLMQEQQHRIEGQEAKLRSDLSSYATKYDECRVVISKGMSKFQQESCRMLKEIEKSKQDYKALLVKYEASTKRVSQLLEERRQWDQAAGLANRKVETLEKLCRALRNGKHEAQEASNGVDKSRLPSLPEQHPCSQPTDKPAFEDIITQPECLVQRGD